MIADEADEPSTTLQQNDNRWWAVSALCASKQKQTLLNAYRVLYERPNHRDKSVELQQHSLDEIIGKESRK